MFKAVSLCAILAATAACTTSSRKQALGTPLPVESCLLNESCIYAGYLLLTVPGDSECGEQELIWVAVDGERHLLTCYDSCRDRLCRDFHGAGKILRQGETL